MEVVESNAETENNNENTFLKKVLNEEEHGSLSEVLVKKIETAVQESFDDFVTQKALFESAKAHHAEELSKLQGESTVRDGQLEELSTNLQKTNFENEKLQEELNNLKDELTKLQETNKKLDYEWQDFKIQRDLAHDEREALLQMVDRRDAEVQCLKTNLSEASKALQSALQSKMEALENAEEVESLKLTLEYKEKRLEQESCLLKSQIESLNEDLNNQTTEILHLKRANSTRSVTAETELAEKSEELRIAHELISDLKDDNEKLTEKVESLLEKQVEQRNASDNMFVNFQQELQAQTKLAQLYKGLCDENNNKTEKLTRSINELQNLLKDAAVQYGDLETKLKETLLQHEDVLANKNECITLLQKEIKDANDLLNQTKEDNVDAAIAQMSPCAAAASRLIKSGMTLTQIYTQYATVSEELLLQKEENRRLELYVTTILKEIEEKAPILMQQRVDYEKAVANVESLTKQMDEMISESQVLHTECAEAKKLSTHLTRENQRLKKELADLGRQVCYLIKAVEEARGGVVTDLDGSQISYDGDSSSAQHVISRRLVTFASIEDLQENNQKLLALVRQLSAKQEAAEGVSTSEYQDLKLREERLEKRVGDLLDEMDRQSKMIELIKNQSLRYKTLYEQALGKTPEPIPEMLQGLRGTPVKGSQKLVTSTPKAPALQDGDNLLSAKYEELQKSLKLLEEEKTKYKEEITALQNQLAEQALKAKTEMNEYVYKNSKLVTQAEFHEEKCKVLETNVKTYKKQVEALEERNRTLSVINAKHEQSVIHLKDETMSAQSKLSRLEVCVDNLQEEKYLLKSAESRLLKEREAWSREKHSHALLMSNLDAIKATFDRSEAEGKLRLEVQLSEALKECSALRSSLKDEQSRFKDLASSLERQTNVAVDKMAEEKRLAEAARSDLATVKEELEAKCKVIAGLNQKIRELTNQPTKSVIESVTTNLDASTKVIKELKKKVSGLEGEVSSLQQQVAAAKQHGAQYAEMAQSLEQQLAEIQDEHQIYSKLMSEKIEEAAKKENEMKGKYEELEKKYRVATSSQKSSAEELNAKLATSTTELKSTSNELSGLKGELQNVREVLDKAKEEIAQLSSALEQAEGKYSNEVVQHGADMKALAAAREELAETVRLVEKLTQERDGASVAMKLKSGMWDEREKRAKEEVVALNKRLSQLDEQNAILHQKTQELGNQVAILHARVADNNTHVEDMSGAQQEQGNTKTQDQFLKVIKFLRQEKDIAVAKSEVLQAENTRLKSQLSLTTKELEEIKEAMKTLKESNDSTKKASEKHAELLRKVDTLNAITDSNRILREERDRYKTSVEALKAQVTQAETKMAEIIADHKKVTEKMDSLNGDNQALLIEAARWKQKANALAERSNKATPEEWRRLTNERENLAKQWQLEKNNNDKIEEELRKVRLARSNLAEQLTEAKKNLANETNEVKRLNEECEASKQQLNKTNEELTTARGQVGKLTAEVAKTHEENSAKDAVILDIREKEDKLKKIAKKYKSQYEELVKTTEEQKNKREEEEKKRAEELAAKPVTISNEEKEKLRDEGRSEIRNELTSKLTDLDNKLNEKCREFEAKIAAGQEETEMLKKDNDSLKTSINEKEERAKQVMKTARIKIVQLTEQKNSLEEELNQIRGQSEHSRDESDSKLDSVKMQYEGIIAVLEKERGELVIEHNQERERQAVQVKSLTQRLSQLQRSLEKQMGAKPSTSSRPVEKSTMEPPTANIKPMAGSSTAARGKQKQATAQQSVAVGPSVWRLSGNETPFASIRPTISMQTRTLAVLPCSQTSPAPSQPPAASQSSSSAVIVPPQQQVHTTGGSADALSSSPTSSHTDYMPATSSATPIRVVVAPTPLSVGPPMGSDAQSTQEMEAEANDSSDVQQQTPPGPSSQPPHPLQAQQTVALVLPRERVEPQATTQHVGHPSSQSVDQSCGQASSSSSTVTTTQAGLKRPRDVEGDSSTGGEGEEMKQVPQSKRTRISVTGSGGQSDMFHHQVTHSEGIEVEYQVPTSSQRDQEDDLIIMVDSEEEGNADEGDVEEPDDEQEFEEDNGEGYEMESYSRDGQGMANFDEGPDIDEENVPDPENNEVEIIDDSNEVPNQSGSSRDGGSDNGATQSGAAAVPVAQSRADPQSGQQSSEATSSGPITEGSSNVVVVSHAASSQSSQNFRSRAVPPLGRQQQSQLMLPQSYEEGGDDSIVPSTPTLYVPRRADGFGEAVSSPQVPHQARFTFSDPAAPISRSGIPPVSGDVLEDVSQLSQLDEPGTGRSVPTTPLQVSPQELPSGESLNEVGQSSRGAEAEGDMSVRGNIPDITVTVAEDDANSGMPPPELESAGEEEDVGEKGSSGEEPEIINLDEDNDGVTSEGEKPPSHTGDIEEGREAEASEPFEPFTQRRAGGRAGGTARRSGKRSAARRPTPIVWNEPGSSSSSGVGPAFPSVLRSHMPPMRILSPEQQAMRGLAMRGKMNRARHRTWR